MENNETYQYDLETGEILESNGVNSKEKESKAKASWGVRLDDDTITELEKIAAIIGAGKDKRAVVEYLLRVRATAELKGQVKGKVDTIDIVEKSLDIIRDEMNSLLRHNLYKEEEIRSVVSSEMEELEDKIKLLQNKLNEQLGTNKELKDENKSLKAIIVDKDKEIKDLTEHYSDTSKLIARLEKTEIETQEKLDEFEEMKLAHKELQATSIQIEKDLSKTQAEVVKTAAELSTSKQSIIDKDKEISSIKEGHQKDLSNLKSIHQLEIEKIVLEKEKELRDRAEKIRDEKDELEKTNRKLEKDLADMKSTTKEEVEKTVAELNKEHEKEVEKLKKQLDDIKKKAKNTNQSR